jgi:predicted ester cyclase
MSTEDNKALLRRYYDEVINKKNTTAIDEFIDPQMVDHAALPGLPGGIEGQRQTACMYLTAFPDTHFMVEDMIAEGDKVVRREHECHTARSISGPASNWQARDVHRNRYHPHRGRQARGALGRNGYAGPVATTWCCPSARASQFVTPLTLSRGIKKESTHGNHRKTPGTSASHETGDEPVSQNVVAPL